MTLWERWEDVEGGFWKGVCEMMGLVHWRSNELGKGNAGLGGVFVFLDGNFPCASLMHIIAARGRETLSFLCPCQFHLTSNSIFTTQFLEPPPSCTVFSPYNSEDTIFQSHRTIFSFPSHPHEVNEQKINHSLNHEI